MLSEYKNKNVLITGGLGMIGSAIANQLVQLDAKVTILDSCMEPYGFNLFNIGNIKERVVLEQGDIRDQKCMRRVIEGMDIVFNFAGQVSHNDSMDNPILDAEINYMGHLNVLEVVRTVNPAIKVVYSGSRLQYGKIDKIPVSEDHPLNPLTPYALNKSTAEQIYLYYSRMYGIPVAILRISNPYGPRGQIKHSKYCMINWFVRLAMENKPITVFGEGNQIRDYIYIDDLSDAIAQIGIKNSPHIPVLNVGYGKGVKFREMAETIVEAVGRGRVEYVPWPEDYINVETGNYVADITRITSCIPWTPKTGLTEGIGKTYEYYREYKQFYL